MRRATYVLLSRLDKGPIQATSRASPAQVAATVTFINLQQCPQSTIHLTPARQITGSQGILKNFTDLMQDYSSYTPPAVDSAFDV